MEPILVDGMTRDQIEDRIVWLEGLLTVTLVNWDTLQWQPPRPRVIELRAAIERHANRLFQALRKLHAAAASFPAWNGATRAQIPNTRNAHPAPSLA